MAEITEDKFAFENGSVIDVWRFGGYVDAPSALDADGVRVLVPEAGGVVGAEDAKGEEDQGKEEGDSTKDAANQAEHGLIVTGVFGFLLAGMGVVGV